MALAENPQITKKMLLTSFWLPIVNFSLELDPEKYWVAIKGMLKLSLLPNMTSSF